MQSASAAKYLCLVQGERGAHELALEACSRSLAALEHAYSIDPQHPARDRDVASVATLAARAALGSGRVEAARHHLERAMSRARAVVEAGGTDRDALALADVLVVRTALAAREGDAPTRRTAADEARTLLAAPDRAPDPEKAAALLEELDQLAPAAGPR
jgi:hypothetical protein